MPCTMVITDAVLLCRVGVMAPTFGAITSHSSPWCAHKKEFECADIDSAGRASFALPLGASSLLIQGTEVWEVRLTLIDK